LERKGELRAGEEYASMLTDFLGISRSNLGLSATTFDSSKFTRRGEEFLRRMGLLPLIEEFYG
jgi:hypothetical protein